MLACALAVGSLVSGGSAFAGAGAPAHTAYEDARFNFNLRYPSDWELTPRTDAPQALSEVLEFRGPGLHQGQQPYIAIGHYLDPISSSTTLTEWRESREQTFDPAEIKTFVQERRVIAGRDALYIVAESPLTEYQLVNIRQGDTVWFIWANFGLSASPQLNGVFMGMVASLDLGPRMPTSLAEIYGEALKPAPAEVTPYLGSDWWAPVYRDYSGNSWAVNCGSSFHTNGASYAADVAASYGWNVRAAKTGTVEKSGWEDGGYGNLVKLNSGYRHIYAHLSYIYPGYPIGSSVSQNTPVGQVGASGTTATHLHFHVQNGQYQGSSSGVDLRGMYGFSANSYYPSSWATCGSMGRPQ